MADQAVIAKGYERELLRLLYSRGVHQITLHMWPLSKAVDLRYRLHKLAKKMREDGAPTAFSKPRTKLSVIFTTPDGVEHKYRDNSSLSPDQEIKSCEIRIALDFSDIKEAIRRDLLS